MSEPFTVVITSPTGSPLAVLDRVDAPRLQLNTNQAGVLSFLVPRGDLKLTAAPIGATVEVRRGGTRQRRGRIISRDVTERTIEIAAMTQEGLLLDYRTPPQYGLALSGLDLADAVRACLDRWHIKRVKWQSEWNAPVSSSGVTTESFNNGVLLLASSGGAYLPSGHAVYQFDATTIDAFVGWDRIRWSSDMEPPVFTSIQYRFGTTGTWLPSSTEQVKPGYESGGFTVDGVGGGIPDRVGLALNGDASTILQVRCNLYTADTTSDDPGGTAQKGVTPFFHALEVIARTEASISAAGVPASTGKTVQGLDADSITALEAIRAMCESHAYRYTLDNQTITLAPRESGTDQTDEPIITSEAQ